MNKHRDDLISIVIGVIVGLILSVAGFILQYFIAEARMPVMQYDCKFIAIEQTQEQAIDTPVITFTREEASELLAQFQAEREAKEKAEREREAARRMSVYSPSYFQNAGRISWGGWSWTWYSERILPGYGLRIPGRYTDTLGYVRDENGYLCLASDVLKKGTVIETPFGSCGKVYDCGCGNNYTVDVYVGW